MGLLIIGDPGLSPGLARVATIRIVTSGMVPARPGAMPAVGQPRSK